MYTFTLKKNTEQEHERENCVRAIYDFICFIQRPVINK